MACPLLRVYNCDRSTLVNHLDTVGLSHEQLLVHGVDSYDLQHNRRVHVLYNLKILFENATHSPFEGF